MLRKIGNNIIGDKMKIKELLKNEFIIGDINDTIIQISKTMKKNNIGFLPIKKNNKIVGTITDRHICIHAAPNHDIANKAENYI